MRLPRQSPIRPDRAIIAIAALNGVSPSVDSLQCLACCAKCANLPANAQLRCYAQCNNSFGPCQCATSAFAPPILPIYG